MTTSFEDLSGRRFGRWKVTEHYEVINGQRKWGCICKCGTYRMVWENNLLSGKSNSCGCLSANLAKKRFKDLTDRKFGFLTAKYRDGYLYGRPAWFCECKCGNTCRASAHDLIEGHKTSCGCKSHEKGVQIKKLQNQRVGKKLTVLYPTEKRDYKGSVIWHCRCDCGKELDLSEDSIVHGNYQSCGCLREDAEYVAHNFRKNMHFLEGTCLELLKRKMRKDNTSGCTGVYPSKNGTYKASITFQGVRYPLGRFSKFEDAVKARRQAEQDIFEDFAEYYKQWQAYCQMTGQKVPFEFDVLKEQNGYSVRKGDIPRLQNRKDKIYYIPHKGREKTAGKEQTECGVI